MINSLTVFMKFEFFSGQATCQPEIFDNEGIIKKFIFWEKGIKIKGDLNLHEAAFNV